MQTSDLSKYRGALKQEEFVSTRISILYAQYMWRILSVHSNNFGLVFQVIDRSEIRPRPTEIGLVPFPRASNFAKLWS